MLKKLQLNFYITLFLFTFMTELYFVTSLNRDLISMVGAFIVLCISSYLLIDAIKDEVHDRKDLNKIKDKNSDNVDYVEVLDKVYHINLEMQHTIENYIESQSKKIEKINDHIKVFDEMRNASLEELIEQQKKLTEYQNKLSSDQKKHLKILVQYNKQFSDVVVHNVVEKTNEIVESLNKVIDSESNK